MPIHEKKILSIQNYFAISRPFILDTRESKAANYGEDNQFRIPNSLEKAHQYFRAMQKNNLDGGSLPKGYFVNRSKDWETY